MRDEIQLTNGETFTEECQDIDRIHVKVSGYVKVTYTENECEYTAHIPPHRIELILGDVTYESPHGRI